MMICGKREAQLPSFSPHLELAGRGMMTDSKKGVKSHKKQQEAACAATHAPTHMHTHTNTGAQRTQETSTIGWESAEKRTWYENLGPLHHTPRPSCCLDQAPTHSLRSGFRFVEHWQLPCPFCFLSLFHHNSAHFDAAQPDAHMHPARPARNCESLFDHTTVKLYSRRIANTFSTETKVCSMRSMYLPCARYAPRGTS